jgi:hypothetical protein
MTILKSHYETLLSEYSHQESAIALLKQYRPYLELIPSMRRPNESVITIPLPVIRIRHTPTKNQHQSIVSDKESVFLSCDLAILMCDPEWKIKMGCEICIFIHRPEEDFSDLLLRWRQTQVFLDQDYEWILPHRYKHIIADPAENVYPLFVLFPDTPDRIKRGLLGAALPFVVQKIEVEEEKDLITNDNRLIAND